MREVSFPYDPDVLLRFPGARAYERGQASTTYLAERAGVPYLLILPDVTPHPVTVLEFEDEHERATYLASLSTPAVG